MKLKKILALTLAAVMIFCFVAACNDNSGTTTPASSDTGSAAGTGTTTQTTTSTDDDDDVPAGSLEDRPDLRFLIWGRTYDPNTDIATVRKMEFTGYNVIYEMLPTEGGDERLMLEMSAGADFDLVELNPIMFGRLASMGMLLPIDDLLAQYGNYMLQEVAQAGWDASKDPNGNIVALPRQSGDNQGHAFGSRFDWILMTKQEILDELDLTIPKTLDEFTDFLITIRDAKGVPPLTSNNDIHFLDIMTAFDIPNIAYLEKDSGFEHLIQQPQYREYLRYIAMLYADGLLDPDVPTNNNENKDAKFTSPTAAFVAQYATWELGRIVPALEANGLSVNPAAFEQPLMGSDGTYLLRNFYGVSKYYGIPASAANPDHAINYFNLLSEPETFLRSHIGDEGIHWEMVNGEYRPILPEFDELNWANQFVGMQNRPAEFAQWQARVRKTVEMADNYVFVNSNLPNARLFLDRSTLTNSLPAVQENGQAVNQLWADWRMQAIVNNNLTDADFDTIIQRMMDEGLDEMLDEMSEWARQNPR